MSRRAEKKFGQTVAVDKIAVYNGPMNATANTTATAETITSTDGMIVARPQIGQGATLHYPQDTYGFVVTKVSDSGKTVTLAELVSPSLATGHTVDRHDGPFPIWDHTYTEDELKSMIDPQGKVTTIRLNKKGRWASKGTPFTVGKARYYRNYSY